MRNVLKAKLDIIFKKLFSENMPLLIDLLSSLLNIPIEKIKNITIKNPEILPESVAGKLSRMDISMEVDGKLIDIEMQCGLEQDYKDRTLFYWSKLYSGELKSGDTYRELKQTICINILDFTMFDCNEYKSHFMVMEKDRHEVLTDKCSIIFFELPKISKKLNKENRAELWLQLINAETEEEYNMLEQTGVAPIQNAVKLMWDMSEDTKVREAARAREETLLAEFWNMNGARKEGIEIGLQQGLQQGKKEMLKEVIENLKNNGISEERIKQILNLGE